MNGSFTFAISYSFVIFHQWTRKSHLMIRWSSSITGKI